MCRIVFVGDIMHINEWVGLLNCTNFMKCISVVFQIWFSYIVNSYRVHVGDIKVLNFIICIMHSGCGLMLFCQ